MASLRNANHRLFTLSLILVYTIFYFQISSGSSYSASPPGSTADAQPSPSQSPVVEIPTQEFVPGDAVEISVFPDTSSFLNKVYAIDGDGYVFLPLIGKTKVTDKSSEEFTRFLTNTYEQYLKFPFIKVRPLIRVSVLGGVQRPGLYFVDPNYSLWNVIQLVGGTLNEDGLKKMHWERDKKTVKENLIPFLQAGTSLKEIGFRSGDQIWVPSPGRPNFFTRLNMVLPIVTLGLSVVTFYLYFQSGRIRGNF